MNTLNKKITIKGVGIHSGEHVTMELESHSKPGISFIYNNQFVEVAVSNIGTNHLRSTTLTNGKITIQTPEHFLAACYALELTSIKVTISSLELPILDGSAIDFINQIQPYLIKITDNICSELKISDNIHFSLKDSHYFLFPSDTLKITVALDYPNHWLKSMTYSFTYSSEDFIKHIAPARTYGFTFEIDQLKEKGLIKGGSLDNAVLISDKGYVNDLRFDDEIIRHKLLDFIGDFFISGDQLQANCILFKPSHQGNCGLLKYLYQKA